MQVYSENNKSTVGTTEIQTPECYKFLSNWAIFVVIIHKAIWRACHLTQGLPNADVENIQCAGAWYRHDIRLYFTICDISFTKHICIYLYMLYCGLFSRSSTTCALKQLSIIVSVLPSIDPLSPHCYRIAVTFVFETGTVRYWLLWNRVVLLINACTTEY